MITYLTGNLNIYLIVAGTKSGLDILRARRQSCTERARKEVFACTELRARTSIKTSLSSTPMLFKVVSYFLCLKASNIRHNKI